MNPGSTNICAVTQRADVTARGNVRAPLRSMLPTRPRSTIAKEVKALVGVEAGELAAGPPRRRYGEESESSNHRIKKDRTYESSATRKLSQVVCKSLLPQQEAPKKGLPWRKCLESNSMATRPPHFQGFRCNTHSRQ